MAQKDQNSVVDDESNIIDLVNLIKVILFLLMFQFDIFEKAENAKLATLELKVRATETKANSTQKKS
jgi:hypothetical protein